VGIVKAKFEGGVLKPEKPLRLRPGEDVRLLVMRQSDPSRWDLERLAQSSDEDAALAEAGLGEWADALDAQDRA
jgi:predicted DNA-binding antitoxin AbrB/MazE fold protein